MTAAVRDEMDVHCWFGLTYANYLVLPRTLLQSMPEAWQHRFVGCLRELEQAFWHIDQADSYMVRAKSHSGKFVADPVPHYNRGRTFVEPHIIPPESGSEVQQYDGGRGA